MVVRDIAILARLVDESERKSSDSDDVAELSPVFQPVARRLVAALPRERQAIWDDFVSGRLCGETEPRVAVESAQNEPSTKVMAAETAQVHRPLLLAGTSGARLAGSGRRVKMTCAVDLQPRPIEWLWSGRVPLGMITMFAGDPKLGKSYVTLAMAAALSRGRPLPLSMRPDRAGSTILMSAEDDPARTIVPRLVAAGADLTKIHLLESVILANGSEALPSLRADIDAITAAATRLGDCRLIVIDPVSAYMEGVDDNRNAALRGVLTPLSRLAEQLSAAVVLVTHLTKAGGTNNGKHRVLGSIAYVGACRANHQFVADPDDPAGRRVLMIDNGSNIAPPAPALAYTIEKRDSGAWIEWSDKPVTSIVASSLKPSRFAQRDLDEPAGRTDDCDDWLRASLADGPRSSAEVFKAGREAGYSKNQIRRAKSRIGVTAAKEGFATSGQWTWLLIPAMEGE